MPSASLVLWLSDRIPRLNEVETQCMASHAFAVPNPRLVDENMRGLILLLSAHFQGYCRDLYSECSQIVASKTRRTLQVLIQQQFTASSALDRGNPNIENLKKDFNRFGIALDLATSDPANKIRLNYLSDLNRWRNIAAHQGMVPSAGLPAFATVQNWKNACNGLAASLDSIMYNHLRTILRRKPWIP